MRPLVLRLNPYQSLYLKDNLETNHTVYTCTDTHTNDNKVKKKKME